MTWSWAPITRNVRPQRRVRGTATAELAIILPTLLLLAFGVLEFGHIFNVWLVASAASREGARQAALGLSPSSVQSQVVLPYLEDSGLAGDTTITLPAAADVEVDPPAGLPGDPVSVYVPLWVEVQTPIVNRLLPANPMKVGAATTVRRQ